MAAERRGRLELLKRLVGRGADCQLRLEPDADRRYQSAAHVAFDLRHPEQVPLTSRSSKLKGAPMFSQAVRWWRARDLGVSEAAPAPETDAHVVMVAVDTMHPDDLRQPELQRATRRMLSIAGEYRLICVSVIAGGPGLNVGQVVGYFGTLLMLEFPTWTSMWDPH